MKKEILLLSFLTLSCALQAQQAPDTLRFGLHKEVGLMLGYDYNFEKGMEGYHFVEVGILKTSYITFVEPLSSNIYFSNEFGLNTEKFVWGPKVGGFFAIGGLVFGLEVVYYTNFETTSLRAVPYLGIGYHKFKLTLNPHIILTDDSFPINRVSANFSFRPFTFTKKVKR